MGGGLASSAPLAVISLCRCCLPLSLSIPVRGDVAVSTRFTPQANARSGGARVLGHHHSPHHSPRHSPRYPPPPCRCLSPPVSQRWCHPASSSPFHPPSTPRAVAREAGGRWSIVHGRWGHGVGGGLSCHGGGSFSLLLLVALAVVVVSLPCIALHWHWPRPRGSSLLLSIHPQSTPRAVAREAGGRWCVVRRCHGALEIVILIACRCWWSSSRSTHEQSLMRLEASGGSFGPIAGGRWL
jgi:hypothetical protein